MAYSWALLASASLLAAACGCAEFRRTVSAAEAVSQEGGVRIAPAAYAGSTKPLPPVPLPDDSFDSAPDAWGRGRRFGALWVRALAEGRGCDGLVVLPGRGIFALERDGGQDLLVRRDSGGVPVSSRTLTRMFVGLGEGLPDGRPPLLLLERGTVVPADLDGIALWRGGEGAPSSVPAVLAEAEGGAALLTAPGSAGVVAALAPDGRRLWTASGLGEIRGLAAGRSERSGPVAFIVLGSSAGAAGVWLLDRSGRRKTWVADSSVPTRALFLRGADGRASLACVGEPPGEGRGVLRIYGLREGALRPAAEADIGPGRVVFAAAGDFNGDGAQEIALAADNGGLFILDARARLLGVKRDGGVAPILAAGDIDGDGREELVVGDRSPSGRLRAYGVVSGP